MTDDEEEDVAIAGDQEPELKPGDLEPSHDEPGEDEDAWRGEQGPLEVVGKRPRRQTSAGRDALRQMMDKFKTERAAHPEEESDDDGYAFDYEEPEVPAPGEAAARADKAAREEPRPPASSNEQQLPAVDRDAVVAEVRKEYEDRERALAEREAAADPASFTDGWVQRSPVDALRDLLKARGIATTDDEWKDEMAELITDISEKVFGTKVDPTLRNTIDVRRAKRAIAAGNRRLADDKAALAKQREQEA